MIMRSVRPVKKIYDLKKQGYPIYYADTVLKGSIEWPASYDNARFFTKKTGSIQRIWGLSPVITGDLNFRLMQTAG